MAAASCTGFAQDALATHPDAIADKCKENNSVFYQFAKSENYADAYQPWYELYTTCPEYSKNIYKYGAYILNWKIKSETDAAKQAEYVDLLMNQRAYSKGPFEEKRIRVAQPVIVETRQGGGPKLRTVLHLDCMQPVPPGQQPRDFTHRRLQQG